MDKYIFGRNDMNKVYVNDAHTSITFENEEGKLYFCKMGGHTLVAVTNSFCHMMMMTKTFRLVHNKEEGHRFYVITDKETIYIDDSDVFWQIKELFELRLVSSDFDDWILQEEYQ